MSARRLVSRSAWIDKHPPNKRKTELSGGAVPSLVPTRTSYHDHLIAFGERHASFQKRVRVRRESLGLPLTASNMHRVHGRVP